MAVEYSVGRRRLREDLSASYTGLLLDRWVVQPSYRIVGRGSYRMECGGPPSYPILPYRTLS